MERGIGVYYGDMIYGRVGFAILEDRDSSQDPGQGELLERKARSRTIEFDPSSVDKEALVLLGGRQLRFLRHFGGLKGTT